MGFNPHTHTGCDEASTWPVEVSTVSIHTPIQGVTSPWCFGWLLSSVSIHTPIQGVTCSLYHFDNVWWVSIHTPIQGVTFTCSLDNLNNVSFNPHTHTGCDHRWIEFSILQYVSIHTPIQGVTCVAFTSCLILVVSIHTPIQGVTFISIAAYRETLSFNPHTHTGCDLLTSQINWSWVCFNPHTHTGCDGVLLV